MYVLITGGSSGIGKHLAAAYLHRGDDVVIVSHDPEKLEAARTELAQVGGRIWAYACDIGEPEQVAALASQVLRERGCPDVLVNNAGYAVYQTFDETDYAEMQRLVRVNFLGALCCTHAFLPAMKIRRSGHIVNISSISGLIPITPCATYTAAKYGLLGISETLRFELRDFCIGVHLVCPGRVETPFFDHPTFQQRQHRPETEETVAIDTVTQAIIRAVETNRFLTVVAPWKFRLLVKLRNIWRWPVDLILGRVLLDRIRVLRGTPSSQMESSA